MNQPVNPAEAIDVDLSGRKLGDLHLLRRLGRGAMAEVYLAEQTSLHRQVAVKVLRSNLAGDELYVRRFHNEARAAAALVHANIVQIHEVGCVDGVHFIAQEYVQGQNLREYLVRHGPPSTAMAIRIMRQVASALSRAGERGIVHRDIKPENIMLAHTGEVKVADFGLARLSGSDAGLNLTQVGITMGTPLYMSPEQIEGKPLDPRSDIYSLGVTCYHMLSGAPPFRGETALAVAVQHLKEQPERLDGLRSDLPGALCRIVHKMLEKDPANRYQSAAELLRDLRAVPNVDDDEAWDDVEGLPGADTLRARIEATERLDRLMKTSALTSRRRPPIGRWAAAIVAMFLLGGAIAFVTRPPYLLAESGEAQIPHEDSAFGQLLAAKREDLTDDQRELVLLDVQKRFAGDDYAVRIANQELAKLYLKQGRTDDAMERFQMLADEDSEPQTRAYGLAGQSFILAQRDRAVESLETLRKLRRLLGEMSAPQRGQIDPEVRMMMSYSFRKNIQEISEQNRQEWQSIIEALPEGGDAEGGPPEIDASEYE